ncbi:MAG: hypothetical protein Q9187_005898 [Circinaria calcarea]
MAPKPQPPALPPSLLYLTADISDEAGLPAAFESARARFSLVKHVHRARQPQPQRCCRTMLSADENRAFREKERALKETERALRESERALREKEKALRESAYREKGRREAAERREVAALRGRGQ